jgi:hypothetical protein
MYDKNMIEALADRLREEVARTRGRGLRLSFEWLKDVLDDDANLTRKVLEKSGFQPPASEVWTTGRGEMNLSRVGFPPVLADKLTDILDAHDA